MKYLMEFFPEVSYEPDTDKWRLFPESKLNQDWYDQFVERPPLNQVQRATHIDGDTLYSVNFEADNDKDAFITGYDLITYYIEKEEPMLHETITCDKCKKVIDHKTEEYLNLDGYWKVSSKFLDDMHFHESCWEEVLNLIDNHQPSNSKQEV